VIEMIAHIAQNWNLKHYKERTLFFSPMNFLMHRKGLPNAK